jgi:hypothetical protein
MVNENHKKFQKEQKDLDNRYIGGARNNNTKAQSDPEYNSGSNTDISPGATGRQ